MDWMAEGAINFIEENKSNPFFLYFATTVPHGPTEANRAWNADPSIAAVGYLNIQMYYQHVKQYQKD